MWCVLWPRVAPSFYKGFFLRTVPGEDWPGNCWGIAKQLRWQALSPSDSRYSQPATGWWTSSLYIKAFIFDGCLSSSLWAVLSAWEYLFCPWFLVPHLDFISYKIRVALVSMALVSTSHILKTFNNKSLWIWNSNSIFCPHLPYLSYPHLPTTQLVSPIIELWNFKTQTSFLFNSSWIVHILQSLYAHLPPAVLFKAQEIWTFVFQQGTVNSVFTAKRNASEFLTSVFWKCFYFSLNNIFIGS